MRIWPLTAFLLTAACSGESKSPPSDDPNAVIAPPPTVKTTQSLPEAATVTVTMVDNLSSGADKMGGITRAIVSGDILDDRGSIVVPSGSVMSLKIVELEGQTTVKANGAVRLEPVSVLVQHEDIAVRGKIDSVPHIIVNRMLIVERATPIKITLTAPLRTTIAK